jgi:hypothetical protein
MTKRSTLKGLSHHQLIELVGVAVELHQREGTTIAVEYDAHIPDMRTGERRQFDVLVRSAVSGREFLRVVEVKDIERPVGSPIVDGLITKASAVGAHRATLVSTSGFARTALARVADRPDLLDAFSLRALREDEAPFDFSIPLNFTFDKEVVHTTLEARAYANGLTDEVQFIVWYASMSDSSVGAAFVMLSPPKRLLPDGSDVPIQTYQLPVRGGPLELAVSLTVGMADGTSRKLTPNTHRTFELVTRRQ